MGELGKPGQTSVLRAGTAIFPEPTANDSSETTSLLDNNIDLIDKLPADNNIDRGRLYATGQSGGCMMSIAMNIKIRNCSPRPSWWPASGIPPW